MAGVSRRRIVWNVAAALSVVLVFTAEVAVGQVVIKDTVQVKISHDSSGASAKTMTGVIVPSTDGALCAFYAQTHRLVTPIVPNSAHVVVSKNADTLAVDEVRSRLPLEDSTNVSVCGFNNVKRYLYDAPSISEKFWTVGQVKANDQIVFAYSSDRGTPPTDVQVQGTDLWLVTMADVCFPQADYLEIVQMNATIVQADTTISIGFSQSDVSPTIPNSGAQSRILDQVDNTVDEIVISLDDACSPLDSQEVKITAEWVYGSGGHLHATSNDSFPDESAMGVFTVLDSARTDTGMVVSRTNAEGEIRLKYQAPAFGGRLNIRAEAIVAGDTLVNANQLTVRVPDLVLLPFDSDYVKLGGTQDHPGPDDQAPFNLSYRPDTNHWALAETIEALIGLNAAWSDTAPSGQYPLWINDMSLPKGGKFDIAGTWTPAGDRNHRLHRVGRDVDIRIRRDGDSHTGVEIREVRDALGNLLLDSHGLTILQNTWFERFAIQFGANPKPAVHNRNHYHLFFYP